jgi:hypothetical protein
MTRYTVTLRDCDCGKRGELHSEDCPKPRMLAQYVTLSAAMMCARHAASEGTVYVFRERRGGLGTLVAEL